MLSPSATVLRRLSACLAAGAVGAGGVLAAAAIATPIAAARGGPAGGYPGPASGGTGYDPHGAEGAAAASQWLRHSGHTFQRLMRMLAERSAQLGVSEPAPLGPPQPPPPYEPLEEPAPPAPEPARPAGPGALPWHTRRGGEADAGPNRPVPVHVEGWPGASLRPQPSFWPCRRAGLPVGSDGWYVVAEGDTLWSIAEVHYGYGEGYLRIVQANRQRIDDMGAIYPCQRLYIPLW